MPSPLYIVEVFSKEVPCTIVFEVLPQIDPNMNYKQPIRVANINGSLIENGYAVAYVIERNYGGATLSSIYLNGTHYKPEHSVDYWFPGYEKPEELVDGSMRVCMAKSSNLGSYVFLSPLNTMPFMDARGIFSYQYVMVSKEVQPSGIDADPPQLFSNEMTEYSRCDIPFTLFQYNGKYKAMVDNATAQVHLIKGTSTFREMPVYEVF
jgi:hypothetical protein